MGHVDSKMTLEVYAQLQQRAKRDHGAAFDRLIRDAHEQLNIGAHEPPSAGFRTSNRTEPEISPEKTPQMWPPNSPRMTHQMTLKTSRFQASSDVGLAMGPAGLEPATYRL
jgi:hypothetical protein